MSLLAKYQSTRTPITNRETIYGKLIGWTGFSAAIVNGDLKERISVSLQFEDNSVADFIMFKDSARNLPNMVRQGGVTASITLQETVDKADPTKTWVNAIALGVEG